MSIHSVSRFALFPLALVAMASPVGAQEAPDEDNYQGEAADRYAMVRVLEGEVTIRKGEVEEALTRGTPVAEGDVLESRGRGVLQLADGTRIAFDGATRFLVAALFKDAQNERQVLLRLDYGRLRINLGGDAHLRVDTPSGTASLKDRAVMTLEAERDRTVRVRVASGRVTFTNNRDEVRLSAGERISTYSNEDRLDRARSYNTYEQDAFEAWADGTLPTRRSASYQRVPREIRHYADDLDEHGDWVETEEAGWCWRPRVSVEWRPFYRGRWGAYSGGLTWVSDDPFGYVTSHFGRWGWTLNHGWYWIPGVYYSPAWVAWNWSGSYCGWAPLNYWNSPVNWGYGSWGGGHCWNVVSTNNFHHHNIHRHIQSDVNVIRTFGAHRDLRAPWTRGPVVVTRAELQNPAHLQRAFDSGVRRERIQAYERRIQSTTGRVIVRRETTPTPTPLGSTTGRENRIPFEDRKRDQIRTESNRDARPREVDHFVPTPQEGHSTNPHRENTKGRGFEVRPNSPQEEGRQTRPRGSSFENRPTPTQEEKRPDPSKGRSFEVRPSTPQEERRPDPPKGRSFEVRPSSPQEDRRQDPPREREPRTPEPRQERREERRPDPPRERKVEVAPPPPRQERREERRSEAPARESRPPSSPANERPSARSSDRR